MKKVIYILLYPLIKLAIALLEWVAIIWALIRLHSLSKINQYFENIDVMTDETQNVVFQYIFNVIFIKRDGIKFGTLNQTISANLAINLQVGKLTSPGKFLCKFLINSNDPAFKL